ncbi:MAG: hypothetical protein U0232_18985 [Thermomicrobiales bacterium]
MIERRRSIRLGLTPEELQQEIAARLARLDALAEHAEEETQFAEYDRFVAELAFQRAAELIEANNRRLAEQLAALGVLPARDEE